MSDHMRAIHYPRWWLIALLMVLLLGFGLLMARVINLNLFRFTMVTEVV